MIIMMSKIFRCPRCHGEVIGILPIILFDHNNAIYTVVGYEGFCSSLRCRVCKVTYDKNYNVVGIRMFKDLQTKRKVMAKILHENWDKYSYKTKKKLWQKYERARKYL